jgi:hypothetical protein
VPHTGKKLSPYPYPSGWVPDGYRVPVPELPSLLLSFGGCCGRREIEEFFSIQRCLLSNWLPPLRVMSACSTSCGQPHRPSWEEMADHFQVEHGTYSGETRAFEGETAAKLLGGFRTHEFLLCWFCVCCWVSWSCLCFPESGLLSDDSCLCFSRRLVLVYFRVLESQCSGGSCCVTIQ